jgi:hypothetical protein
MWRRSMAATDVQVGSVSVMWATRWRRARDAASTVEGREDTESWSR